MPYQQLPQINDRKSEKLAVFLTVENMVGLALVAGPVFLISDAWPLLLRALAILVAAIVGVTLTVPISGLPLYMQTYWLLRGLVYTRFGDGDITPAQLAGAVSGSERRVALPLDGLARPQKDATSIVPSSTPADHTPTASQVAHADRPA
jgi:hypothetical protein